MLPDSMRSLKMRYHGGYDGTCILNDGVYCNTQRIMSDSIFYRHLIFPQYGKSLYLAGCLHILQEYCTYTNIRGYEIWFVIAHNHIVDSHITNKIIEAGNIIGIYQYLQEIKKKWVEPTERLVYIYLLLCHWCRQ